MMTNEEAISVLQTWRITGDTNHEALDMAIEALKAQDSTDEWCTDCKEYDAEKHNCPRFNRVIRSALQDSNLHTACTKVAQDVPDIHDGDMIYKNDVLYALEKCRNQCCHEDKMGDEWIHYETAQNEIECLQPVRIQANTVDMVNRQAAIDAITELCMHYTPTKSVTHPHMDFVIEELAKLPSAEPIHCKDCVYWKTGTVSKICTKGIITSIMNRGDEFCSYAERRTNDE